MNTLPPIAFEGHVRNLLDFLRRRVPEVDGMPLRFFDQHELRREEGRWVLPASALRDMGAMRALFERLCGEGREWIHLAGAGATPQGQYLVSVDYSQSVGHETTYVNLAGPPLNADGSVKQLSDVILR